MFIRQEEILIGQILIGHWPPVRLVRVRHLGRWSSARPGSPLHAIRKGLSHWRSTRPSRGMFSIGLRRFGWGWNPFPPVMRA